MDNLAPSGLFPLVLFMGLLPFFVIGVTSFIKFSVVLALVRNALGVQQIPPNIVLYGIALMMSFYVMLPTALQSGAVIEKAVNSNQPVLHHVQDIVKPFVEFTAKHTEAKDKQFFEEKAKDLWGEELASQVTGKNATPLSQLVIQVPAFMISELTKAFLIGFLIYLPFLVIDLIVANILLALGMATLSPVTISLPLKILLFIGMDGWRRLLDALVMSYVV